MKNVICRKNNVGKLFMHYIYLKAVLPFFTSVIKSGFPSLVLAAKRKKIITC